MPLTHIHHVGIAVNDLDAAIERYTSALGMRVAALETNVEQGVREAMLEPPSEPGSYTQLLEPLGHDTPVGRFLDRRGEGLHHVAYTVEDIDAELKTLAAQGVALIDIEPRRGSMGSLIAFAHPANLHGVLIELVQAARA